MILAVPNNFSSFLASNKRLLIVIGLLLLSNAGVFGQTAQTDSNIITLESTAANSNQVIALDNDLDFMNWFMGTNQNQNNNNVQDSNSISTKKQFINSGITPNRVLYKTLLKKVSSIDRALV